MPASVELDGLEETLNNLDQLPDEVRRELRDALDSAANEGRNEAIRTLTQKQSGYQSGRLRSTIDIRKRPETGDLEAIVSAGGRETQQNGFDYALAVEFGSRPHFPPVKAVTGRTEGLDIWVKRMSPSPQENESQEEAVERVAFQIARKISRRGTKEMPFMRPGFKAAREDLDTRLKSIDIDL